MLKSHIEFPNFSLRTTSEGEKIKRFGSFREAAKVKISEPEWTRKRLLRTTSKGLKLQKNQSIRAQRGQSLALINENVGIAVTSPDESRKEHRTDDLTIALEGMNGSTAQDYPRDLSSKITANDKQNDKHEMMDTIKKEYTKEPRDIITTVKKQSVANEVIDNNKNVRENRTRVIKYRISNTDKLDVDKNELLAALKRMDKKNLKKEK